MQWLPEIKQIWLNFLFIASQTINKMSSNTVIFTIFLSLQLAKIITERNLVHPVAYTNSRSFHC